MRKVYVKITEVETVQRQTQLYGKYAAELKRLAQLRLALTARFRMQRAARREIVRTWAQVPVSRERGLAVWR